MATKDKRPAGKCDTVKAKNATFYAEHTTKGRFKEMDEKGRSFEVRPTPSGDEDDAIGPRRPGRLEAQARSVKGE